MRIFEAAIPASVQVLTEETWLAFGCIELGQLLERGAFGPGLGEAEEETSQKSFDRRKKNRAHLPKHRSS